jgi:hypothetical protein
VFISLDVAGLYENTFIVPIALALGVLLLTWLPAKLSPIERIHDEFR